jgi:hypothetical protein
LGYELCRPGCCEVIFAALAEREIDGEAAEEVRSELVAAS